MADSDKSIVGDLINFRGLVYAPMNENGVVFLFGKVAEDLNMYIEEIKPGFPDCIARRFTGKGWERVRVEFEFSSRNFDTHKHDASQCDMIICWEHDWDKCPIEVVALKDIIDDLPNPPIQRPDKPQTTGSIEDWFDNFDVQAEVRKMFDQLLEFARGLNEECFFKVGLKMVSFYSPERVFMYMHPRKTMLRLWLFTSGETLDGVKPFGYEKAAAKWGHLSITSIKELDKAKPTIKESYNRIKKAIKNNESTGWYAKVDGEDDGEEPEAGE